MLRGGCSKAVHCHRVTEASMLDAEEDEASNPRALLIPVKNSEQAVEVFVDELPDDVNDIIDILRAEVAPLDVWLQFAVRVAPTSAGRGCCASANACFVNGSFFVRVLFVCIGGVLQSRPRGSVPGDLGRGFRARH